jgi:GTP-dependent phosphoenolpyruvate carboxykinase
MANMVECAQSEAAFNLSISLLNSASECIHCQKTQQELQEITQKLKSAQNIIQLLQDELTTASMVHYQLSQVRNVNNTVSGSADPNKNSENQNPNQWKQVSSNKRIKNMKCESPK